MRRSAPDARGSCASCSRKSSRCSCSGPSAAFSSRCSPPRRWSGCPCPAPCRSRSELSPDLRVFAFALAISLAAGLVFGLAPALARGADGHRFATARRLARQRQLSRVPDARVDRRPAGAVARAARGRRAVPAGAGQRAADRSGLRDRRRGDGVARAGVLGLRPGQVARVLSHAPRTGRGAARRHRRSPTPAACRS